MLDHGFFTFLDSVVNLTEVQALTLDDFITQGLRIWNPVALSGLKHILQELTPLIKEEHGSPYWMTPLILSLIYEVKDANILEHQRICWLEDNGM